MEQTRACAKINLGLDILARRPDGFHDLATIFLEVGVADDLSAAADPAGCGDTLTVEGPFAEGVPTDGRNLAIRALEALRAELGRAAAPPPLRLRLTKNVPHGAGLGGGSSDAAAALRLANVLWGRPAATERLQAVAARIGSDCAFFVQGGAAIGRGRGERLEPIAVRRRLDLVLVKPPVAVATGPAYAALDPAQDFGERSDLAALTRWLGGAQNGRPELHNAFQRTVTARHPEIAEALRLLREAGAVAALLSGSGSACFGLAESAAAATDIARTIHRATGWWTTPTRTG